MNEGTKQNCLLLPTKANGITTLTIVSSRRLELFFFRNQKNIKQNKHLRNIFLI